MPIDLSEAFVQHRQGDLERAAKIYEAALIEDPDRPEALHLLGLVALQRGDSQRAVSLLSRATALVPGEADYQGGLAEAYWALGQHCVGSA